MGVIEKIHPLAITLFGYKMIKQPEIEMNGTCETNERIEFFGINSFNRELFNLKTSNKQHRMKKNIGKISSKLSQVTSSFSIHKLSVSPGLSIPEYYPNNIELITHEIHNFKNADSSLKKRRTKDKKKNKGSIEMKNHSSTYEKSINTFELENYRTLNKRKTYIGNDYSGVNFSSRVVTSKPPNTEEIDENLIETIENLLDNAKEEYIRNIGGNNYTKNIIPTNRAGKNSFPENIKGTKTTSRQKGSILRNPMIHKPFTDISSEKAEIKKKGGTIMKILESVIRKQTIKDSIYKKSRKEFDSSKKILIFERVSFEELDFLSMLGEIDIRKLSWSDLIFLPRDWAIALGKKLLEYEKIKKRRIERIHCSKFIQNQDDIPENFGTLSKGMQNLMDMYQNQKEENNYEKVLQPKGSHESCALVSIQSFYGFQWFGMMKKRRVLHIKNIWYNNRKHYITEETLNMKNKEFFDKINLGFK